MIEGVYVWFVAGGSIVVCVSFLEDVGGSGYRSGVLIVGLMAAGVALGIGFGAVLNLHFLKKRWFLSVILPDLSTLIQYWWFGRTVMTFPVVFHWWFSGPCMATVLLFVMGRGCGCVYCTFVLFWRFGGGVIHHGIVQLLPIQGVACRSLDVKGWNYKVGGEVGVAPVIGHYFQLGYFWIVEWPKQNCHCPKDLGGLCFHSLSTSWFLPWVLPSHWIGGMQLRIVYALHTMFEGILGIVLSFLSWLEGVLRLAASCDSLSIPRVLWSVWVWWVCCS